MQRDQAMPLDGETTESTTAPRFDPRERLTSANILAGFLPAFRHLETGEVRLCKLEDGRLSSEHLLEGLPDHWVLNRDARGRASGLVYAIEPGFLRGIEFWTLADFKGPALDA